MIEKKQWLPWDEAPEIQAVRLTQLCLIYSFVQDDFLFTVYVYYIFNSELIKTSFEVFSMYVVVTERGSSTGSKNKDFIQTAWVWFLSLPPIGHSSLSHSTSLCLLLHSMKMGVVTRLLDLQWDVNDLIFVKFLDHFPTGSNMGRCWAPQCEQRGDQPVALRWQFCGRGSHTKIGQCRAVAAGAAGARDRLRGD